LTSSVGTKHYVRLHEPPCTDPYARWCGRAKAVRPSPIPMYKAVAIDDRDNEGSSIVVS
jgi:hypothetical protein